MKFEYDYRTADNIRHHGVVSARDRDVAYAQLKRQGIRPSRLVEAPGVLNKVLGKGKRWLAILLLAIFALAALFYAWFAERRGRSDVLDSFDDETRRQPIGDVAVIDNGVRTGWQSLFPEEGERFLASFAVPGVPAGVRSTTEAEIEAALKRNVPATANDTIEARQIKAMVEGMKRELRDFIAAGGTIRQYGKRLVARQEEELSYYRRAKMAIDTAVKNGDGEAKIAAMIDRYNGSLRRMGVRLLTMPENLPTSSKEK